MKKLFYSVAMIAFVLSSCSKQDGTSSLDQPSGDNSASQVPSSFGKKVLVEDLTGAWCGYCPRATYYFNILDTTYPGKLVGVAIHVNDVMEDQQLVFGTSNAMDTLLGNVGSAGGYPNGSVDRMALNDPTNWSSDVPSQVGLFAKCGFSIDASSLSGNSLSVTVNTGFAAALAGDYRLNVWIIEDGVHSATNSLYDQHNYYSQSSSSPDPTYPYYSMSDPINDFHHENVLRKMLTAVPCGDAVPQDQMLKGGKYTRTFTADLTGYDKTKTYVVAFLDKFSPVPTTNNSSPQHQVQNVQKVKVGSTIGWN